MRRQLSLALLVAALSPGAAHGSQGGRSPRLAIGERLYREGIGVSGAPVQATVEGDVAVSGEQLRCASCHGRSGMGSIEGRKLVVPVAAPFLSLPRTLRSRPRPPYSDESLIRALREGIDPGGNRLDPMMPRYRLGDADAAALTAYLRQLSAQPSPGVEGKQIHFATVIAPGVPAAERDAMLAVLKAFFRQKTANAHDNRSRHIASWPEYYGDWVLHVWQLKGPESTWAGQLEAAYRAHPVFAVVSGLGNDAWSPVQRFCERKELPCLLPNLDTPPDVEGEHYSLYFSAGTRLEAEVIAARLRQAPAPQRVLQVYVRGGPGERAARVLAQGLRPGRDRSLMLALAKGSPPSSATLSARARKESATAVVLWLDADALRGAASAGPVATAPVYLSSTLLGGDPSAAEVLAGQEGFLVQPYAPPAVADARFRRVGSWLADEHIPSPPALHRVEDQTFFALTVLSEGFMHLKKNFLRDYLFESMDHFSGLENFSSDYPRLSFGPGQRLLSKGCYLIPLRGAGRPEWVVP